MTELIVPKEWVKINISEVADVDLGKTPKKKDYKNDGSYKVIKFRDVSYDGIDWSKNKDGFVPESAIRDLRKLDAGDVLITASAHSSEHIGRKICFVNKVPKNYKNVFYCGELLGIRAYKDILDPKFVFLYFLSHGGYKEIQSHVKGVHLTSGQARNMTVPYASYEEQSQIIAIVEQLFSDLDNAIDNLKKAKDQLKVYRQSVLKYAFEGKYSGCTKTWKTEPIGEICKVVSGNTPKGVNDILTDGDIPFYKVADMNTEGNELFMRKAKINLSVSECKKLRLKTFPKGTVIFPKRGGAILTNKKRILSKESAFDLNLMGVIPGENVRERFLFDWFLALDLGTLYDGSNVPQINHSDIEPLKFPQVSIEIQDDVIKEVESRLSVCDKMEETINNSLEQAEALRQSILKQAFEGKLTEDWRKKHPDLISGENSAKALLERIKKEREALKNTKKRKK
jgi:type I restriction enzyme, S subunit